MDDAVNIHGNYHPYNKREAPDTLILGIGHFQQRGVLTYRAGDEVAVIDSTANEVKLVAHVTEAELVDIDTIRLRLDREVDEPEEHWVTENWSTAPEVHIHDTESGYNRPRGFLLSSRGKTLVERCKFYNMEQGIQLSGEMRDWYESGAALDVITILQTAHIFTALRYSVSQDCAQRSIIRILFIAEGSSLRTIISRRVTSV